MAIDLDLDVELARAKMSLAELSRRVGVTPATLSVLKNGRARAVRFSTLDALCRALGCQPGGLRRHVADDEPSPTPSTLSDAMSPASPLG